jgi:putative ABC transport system substrate-binding protein
MSRRELMAALAAAGLPRLAGAQTPPKPARIGWITLSRPEGTAGFIGALRAELADLGYVEGRNLTIEARYGNDAPERLPELIGELVRLPVDVLVSQGPATLVVDKLRLSVPVVYAYSGDPVVAGLAENLARPLRNMTGQTFMSIDLNGKRLALLHEMMPGLRRIAIVANPMHAGESLERANSEEMAQQLGMTIRYFPTRNRQELDAAFGVLIGDHPEAIVLFPDAFAIQNRQPIVDFGMSQRVPVVSGWAIVAEAGALFTYGPRLTVSYRRLAYYIDRILKGAKPTELPIERPTVLELVINLNTAKALGVTVPPSLLARADEVIE